VNLPQRTMTVFMGIALKRLHRDAAAIACVASAPQRTYDRQNYKGPLH